MFVAVCRQHEKPGKCPRAYGSDVESDQCEVECHDDADCRGDHKCCISGCNRLCTSPEDERYTRPTAPPTRVPHHEERETALQEVPEEDLRPVAREGGVATLRCFATGFPPPSISWKRGGIEVN